MLAATWTIGSLPFFSSHPKLSTVRVAEFGRCAVGLDVTANYYYLFFCKRGNQAKYPTRQFHSLLWSSIKDFLLLVLRIVFVLPPDNTQHGAFNVDRTHKTFSERFIYEKSHVKPQTQRSDSTTQNSTNCI